MTHTDSELHKGLQNGTLVYDEKSLYVEQAHSSGTETFGLFLVY